MRSVWRCCALALICVVLVPSVMAAGVPSASDPGLWEQFVAWLQGRISIPGGLAATEGDFLVWLMGRISIPGG
jgi:hypothetical protein